MNIAACRTLPMPSSLGQPNDRSIELKNNVLVVIGANGSGKTRFGAWLDSQNITGSHRVAAHRSLVFPERVSPIDEKEATGLLLFGSEERNPTAQLKHGLRWQSKPEIALLQDFHLLGTLLVSESFKLSDQYRLTMQAANEYQAPPETRLDKVKRIWELILPSRRLNISGTRIEVLALTDDQAYPAKEMSDGERAIFYIIGQALSAPPDGVFIVDEPELHLHRAIQARLWDAIERERPDCTFVYITHDLGFAASRKDATKVWLKEFIDARWEWELVPEESEFSETMLLEIMGSRHPILFVEGDRGSVDYFIYGTLFPDRTVIPCGSCEAVIHSIRSFGNLPQLHHNTCGGIIDNDGRPQGDIDKLRQMGVSVLPVAIVENLFLSESVLHLVATRLNHDVSTVVEGVKGRIFQRMETQKDKIVSDLTRQEIEMGVRNLGAMPDGRAEISNAFSGAVQRIDPSGIFDRWNLEITRVIREKDYPSALRYYSNKGLAAEANGVFGIRYTEQIQRWLRSGSDTQLLDAIRSNVPAC